MRTLAVLLTPLALLAADNPDFQYKHGDIAVPKAFADEPKLEQPSLDAALRYLEQGARAWVGDRKCVSCHTTGTYMLVRPQLTKSMGRPPEDLRGYLSDRLEVLAGTRREWFLKAARSEQPIYLAAGLAEWDANVEGKLSAETDQALRLMFDIQQESGTWVSDTCWPPLESSAFHAATIAARAAAVAPGWLQQRAGDAKVRESVSRLKRYLRDHAATQNDYDRVSLLWTASRMPDLLDAGQKKKILAVISDAQRPDGGWALRSFSKPEKWGAGNRADRLRAEPEFGNPPSDGHMTGLALIVLRDSGVPASDPRIRRGIAWLRANQRVSGRWWTKSLNTDGPHYITYSGTAYPLLALVLCGDVRFPRPNGQPAASIGVPLAEFKVR